MAVLDQYQSAPIASQLYATAAPGPMLIPSLTALPGLEEASRKTCAEYNVDVAKGGAPAGRMTVCRGIGGLRRRPSVGL